MPLDAISPELCGRILGLLKGSYRYIVLDVPPMLTETTRCALSHAAAVLLVANLFDLTTLADSRLWLEATAGHDVSREAIQIVLNRVSARNRLPLSDIERALNCRVSWQVANDGKLVPASVNAGNPFVLSHPGSRIAQSILEIARSFSAAENSAAENSAAEIVPLPKSMGVPHRPMSFSPLLRRGGRT